MFDLWEVTVNNVRHRGALRRAKAEQIAESLQKKCTQGKDCGDYIDIRRDTQIEGRMNTFWKDFKKGERGYE